MTIHETIRDISARQGIYAAEVLMNADDYEAVCGQVEMGLPPQTLTPTRVTAIYGVRITPAPDGTLERGHGLLVKDGAVLQALEWDVPELPSLSEVFQVQAERQDRLYREVYRVREV